MDPLLVWTAVEAIATAVAALAAIVAAIFIIPEWRRERREHVSHKVEGYQLAMDLLGSDAFLGAARELQSDRGPGVAHDDWFDRYPPLLFEVLRTFETIDFLIDEGYLDEPLLFRLEGFRISRLGKLVSAIEQSRNSPRITYWSELYSNGHDLLDRAMKWREDQTKWQFLSDSGNPADLW